MMVVMNRRQREAVEGGSRLLERTSGLRSLGGERYGARRGVGGDGKGSLEGGLG